MTIRAYEVRLPAQSVGCARIPPMLNRLVFSARGLGGPRGGDSGRAHPRAGAHGIFQDRSVEGGRTRFSWGVAAWLVAPHVAFATLVLWAGGSARMGFRVTVAVTSVVVVISSVLLDVLTLSSDENLAAVGVLVMPVLYLGGATVPAVLGLVLHRNGVGRTSTAPQVRPLAEPGRPAPPRP